MSVSNNTNHMGLLPRETHVANKNTSQATKNIVKFKAGALMGLSVALMVITSPLMLVCSIIGAISGGILGKSLGKQIGKGQGANIGGLIGAGTGAMTGAMVGSLGSLPLFIYAKHKYHTI